MCKNVIVIASEPSDDVVDYPKEIIILGLFVLSLS